MVCAVCFSIFLWNIPSLLSSRKCASVHSFPLFFNIMSTGSTYISTLEVLRVHDDVMKWKHFPRNWPFVRGIHRSPVNSPHKGQWREALMFTLICARINGWVNNRETGDLRRSRAHYDVIVMFLCFSTLCQLVPHIFQPSKCFELPRESIGVFKWYCLFSKVNTKRSLKIYVALKSPLWIL